MGGGIGGQGIIMRLKGFACYELVPVVTFVSAVCLMAGTYSAYALFTKSDVSILRHSTPHPWIRVKGDQPQKLHVGNQKYIASPAIEQLQREIGSRK